ncbi:DnaJ-class molecular chaperone with C-terminal Zn finger domain [Bernardetia litoralis DSM 6794]|uniref:DnaJ-class molecular chaperone with C-terminal Zn finger domain n=1 Tax=Bernardetia litoralis (strain ATCC 23117 / DSM 6794 / NBRC 15988 / NCIMB 1366 / Fx l1 / Sio-4) TaxID=880071 RepID=I4AKI0_BERLS|nr:J domain-containing protein [Bernardetia litoralis]AFM04465.1 DnaJ-class molecular chaperone with C-terminal Zn finger domain [Bernardetia litoralis DSM 6794]
MLFDRLKNIVRSTANDFLEKNGLSDDEYTKAIDDEYEKEFGSLGNNDTNYSSSNFDTEYEFEAPKVNPKERIYYHTLGLEQGASFEQVKTAYKKLMKAYHPDRHQADPKKQHWAVEQSQKVNEAYAFLEKKFGK